MSTEKSSNEQKQPGRAIKSLDEFLGILKELSLAVPAVLVVAGLNDASVEGIVFDDEGDYIDGQPLGEGVYVVLGFGKIEHALKPGVHILP